MYKKSIKFVSFFKHVIQNILEQNKISRSEESWKVGITYNKNNNKIH